jgi:hypothetical protein
MAEESYVQNIRLPVYARALEICLELGEGLLFVRVDGSLKFYTQDSGCTT